MDFSSIISSLSTSGAQWYNLVAQPGNYNPNIPAFQPPSQAAFQAQTASSALNQGGGLLFVGLLIGGAYLLIKALK